MFSTRKFLIAAVFIGVFALGFLLAREEPSDLNVTEQPFVSVTPTPTASPRPEPARVLQDVPFAAQAPFGDWDDPRQQDGCEEASVIMAMRWVRGQGLTKEEMLQEIFKLADWGEKKFGTFRETSIDDTIKFVTEYYGHSGAMAYYDITTDDIKRELREGRVVLVPMNGQWLNNPYYTAPGPEYHFLLIKGYDDNKGVFITNDPGTRQGESYRYTYSRLFDAIRAYQTGHHEPVPDIIKAMISVSR